MPSRRAILRRSIWTASVVAGALASLWLLGLFLRGDVTQPPPEHDPADIAEIERARAMPFDPADPLVLHETVDYDQGADAPWWPKGEPTVLQPLVDAGDLPPVNERVGPEPAVMRSVDGVGRYGGLWRRVSAATTDVASVAVSRMSYAGLVRWSPQGPPIVPHIAKTFTASDDARLFTIRLREGVRWSDGHPLTADDIMYWWNHEVLSETVGAGSAPDWLRVAGEPADIVKIDDLTIQIRFPKPAGLFPQKLALESRLMVDAPAHYLSRFHPDLGDPDFIETERRANAMPSPRALYQYMKLWNNTEHPRMWPWIYRGFTSNAPHILIRNPYYPVVDPEGNQLPYIDRLRYDRRLAEQIVLSAGEGAISMQARHIHYEDHTELMTRRDAGGYRVLHWYQAVRSPWVLNPNHNRLVRDDEPDTARKAPLLADPRFRKALSLAIDRDAIIQAEYNDQVRPSQVAPGRRSPFHSERLAQAFVQHDPETANRLLDELGLTRDDDGWRRFPDGAPMVFYIDFSPFTGEGPAQFIVDDWSDVGVRAVLRPQGRRLFYMRKDAADFDFNVWTSEGDHFPLIEPRYFLADDPQSFYAPVWGRWYLNGGFYGDPRVENLKSASPPPPGHPMLDAYALYERAVQAPSEREQLDLMGQVLDIAADNLWTIAISESPPQLVVVDNDMRGVPEVALTAYQLLTPGNAGIETYFFQTQETPPSAAEEIRQFLITPTLRTPRDAASASAVLRALLLVAAALAVVALGLRHPYIGRRLLIMLPTLLLISVVVFVIVQLPPGDFLTAQIIQLQETGDAGSLAQIEELKRLFRYDDPAWLQYFRWMGFRWFVSFSQDDLGLLQGFMGRSMESTLPVNRVVGDRILLTFLISLATILFTWTLAIPIGIFSAVKQYSLADYALTLLGFLGMSVPAFLLALVLMATADVSGLFSPEYATMPGWTPGKVLDLLKHVWIPVVVLGVGGTAGMIRIMRANLLDEMRKPYVTTARAKGVRPVKLLFKYPVRIALNPFISGIGYLFPQLVSGGAIVAMVLSLPTVGPLLLQALFNEDMYLAGSMLMVLSLLGVVGTLVSDLLLLWLDPRIRYENT